MAEKFATEDLEKIKELRDGLDTITIRLGQIELEHIALDSKKEAVKEQYNSLKASETQLLQELSQKYGMGSINLETGEFTPLTD